MICDGRLSSFNRHWLADIASRTPVTEDTVFRIGSITKTFTAMAVLLLAAKGLVDLDAPAADYLRTFSFGEAKPWHRPPTIRQLLTHRQASPAPLPSACVPAGPG